MRKNGPGVPLVLTLATLSALAACGSRRPVEPLRAGPAPRPATVENEEARAAEPATGPPSQAVDGGPSLEDLYTSIELAERDYRAGIEMIAAGDEVSGEERIASATNRLRESADRCAVNVACEIDRFFDAFERLLSRQGIALKEQAFRIAEMEAGAEEQEASAEEEPGASPAVDNLPNLGTTVSLLRGTDLRDLISLNGPVKAAMNDWLTWMRPLLVEAYENYVYLRPDIAPVYEESGMPEALLFAMLATETGGKVHAVSRAGAAGPFQFMRYTGRLYGLNVVNGFDMRMDPVAATRANVAYLNDRFAELNSSLELALAAYNGGESRVQGLRRRLGDVSLWDKRMFYALPRETREYVPRILAAAWLFLHPDDYGLEFSSYDTSRAPLVLRRETSLGELAICLGQAGNGRGWFRTLRNLNPRIEAKDRLEAGAQIVVPTTLAAVYEERCLDGEIIARARELHDADYPEEPEIIPYVVRRGDTLARIAARHRCVSMAELAAINNIRPPRYLIRVGQLLKIPGCN